MNINEQIYNTHKSYDNFWPIYALMPLTVEPFRCSSYIHEHKIVLIGLYFEKLITRGELSRGVKLLRGSWLSVMTVVGPNAVVMDAHGIFWHLSFFPTLCFWPMLPAPCHYPSGFGQLTTDQQWTDDHIFLSGWCSVRLLKSLKFYNGCGIVCNYF